MVRTVRFFLLAFLICGFCAVVTAGCNEFDQSDDDDVQSVPATPVPPGAAAFTGTYVTTINHNTQNPLVGGTPLCGDPQVQEHVNLAVSIVGFQINISGTSDSGTVFNINTTDVTENTMEFSYSFPDGGGTTTSSVFLFFNGDPFTNFNGSADYSYEGPGGPCVGTDSWFGVKQPGSGLDDLNGAWLLSVSLVSENCDGESPVEAIAGVPVFIEHFGDSVNFGIPDVLNVTGTFDAEANVVSFSSEYVDVVGKDEIEFNVNATGDLTLNAPQTQMMGEVTHEYTPVSKGAGGACTVTTTWTLTRALGLQE